MKRAGALDHALGEVRRRLDDAQARYDQLYDFVPVPMLTLDRSGVIRHLNHAAARLLATDPVRVTGMPLAAYVRPADGPTLGRHLARCRRGSVEEVSSEVSLMPRRAAPVRVRLVSQRLPPGENGPHGDAFWTALIDLSGPEQLEVERELLAQQERAARRASEAKDLFISVLSHELRTPLTALSTAAALLAQGPPSAEGLERLCDLIRRNVAAQARLVDDLLDLSRLTRKKVRLALAPTDVHQTAHEAAEALAAPMAAKGVTLTIDLRAPQHVVRGDASRLRQVFANLLKNAIEATPPGGRVDLRSWNGQDRLVVEVSDTGVGIAGDDLARLFVPFEQGSPTTSSGLGLGLPIVRELVELHHGRVVASSAGPGKGARFLVELTPLAATVAVAPSARRLERLSQDRPAGRILLVEDNADISETLATILRAEGYAVDTAATLKAALAFDPGQLDLLLSDIELPDGRGFDLVRHLNHTHPVPAFALSGRAARSSAAASRRAGFAAYFSKPFDLPALLEAIRVATRPAPEGPHRQAAR